VTAASASACITVGVYEDSPTKAVPALAKATGHNVSAISTYVTAGDPLSASVIAAANRAHASLVVTWDPDSGHDGAKEPKYRLKRVTAGRYDASLKALTTQLLQVHQGAVLRPMPEMNTPWYAWSGAVNGNSAAQYKAAWARVRRAVRSVRGGGRIKLLWAPYAASIPDTSANALSAYFPGASQVDLVGASAYNFGGASALDWEEPGALFASAYQAIEALAPKPFWLAETGSTATGGDKAAWIQTLASLPTTGMPRLAGVIWYDVKDPSGDFRLQGKPVTSAFGALLAAEGCE
jgi:hypothetical protein